MSVRLGRREIVMGFIAIVVANLFVFTLDLIDQILIFSVLMCLVFGYLEYRKEKNIMSLGNAFTIYWFFYTHSIWLNLKLGYVPNEDMDNLLTLTLLSMVAYLSFQLVYFPAKSSPVLELDRTEYDVKLLQYVLAVFFAIGLIMQAFFFARVGFSTFVNLTRPQRSLLLSETINFSFDLLQIIMILGLILYVTYKAKPFLYLAILSLVHNVVYAIIIIDRSMLLEILLPLMFMGLAFGKIRPRTVLIAGTSLFVVMSYFKVLMSNLLFGRNTPFDKFRFNSEFEGWYYIGSRILTELKNGTIQLMYGQSYADTLINLIVPFTSTEPLSVWYVRSYFYDMYAGGAGLAFSSIAEALMNFGYMGVPLYFAFLGFICRWLKVRKNTDTKYLFFYILVFTVLYKFFRAESYSLMKTTWWFYVLPMLLVFLVAKKAKQSARDGGSGVR